VALPTLFVMDPLDRIQVSGDSTFVMMLEAQRRGWPVWFCTPGDLFGVDGRARAWAQRVAVSRAAPHFVPEPRADVPLSDFAVVWMRKDPPFDIDYVFATYLLDLAGPDTLVLNRPESLRNANEKMYALQWPALCPPTRVVRRISEARRFAAELGERVVIKPWDGNGGRGVLVTHASDPNLGAMLELLTDEERRFIMVQRYIPEIAEGDKRIILIDGEPRGWMLRVPQPGDHRGNMHVGAKVVACELTRRDREICDALAPRLKAEGLLFVGIDTIGEHLTEINVTSPTGFQEIDTLMGTDLARELTDAVEAAVGERLR